MHRGLQKEWGGENNGRTVAGGIAALKECGREASKGRAAAVVLPIRRHGCGWCFWFFVWCNCNGREMILNVKGMSSDNFSELPWKFLFNYRGSYIQKVCFYLIPRSNSNKNSHTNFHTRIHTLNQPTTSLRSTHEFTHETKLDYMIVHTVIWWHHVRGKLLVILHWFFTLTGWLLRHITRNVLHMTLLFRPSILSHTRGSISLLQHWKGKMVSAFYGWIEI